MPAIATLLGLQRSIGNRATATLIGSLRRVPERHAAAGRKRALLQRAGGKTLNEQIVTSRSAGIIGWAEALETSDATFKAIMEAIRAYDALADGRPAARLANIDAVWKLVVGYRSSMDAWSEDEVQNFVAIKHAVLEERLLMEREHARLVRFTRGPDAPYEMMTSEGALWTDPDWELSSKNVGFSGRPYFNFMSTMNRMGLQEEIGGRPEGWVEPMLARVRAALESAVLNHYTTATRAAQMLAMSSLKSKTTLAKEVASFRHNTSAYDDYGLANAGFVFFFIEPKGEPLRATRFAKGEQDEAPSDPARISIPIGESGLLTHGWVMLSDFAQREFPTITAKADAPSEHTSFLPTRDPTSTEKGDKPAETEKEPARRKDMPVRHFEQGVKPLEVEEMIAMHGNVPDRERRQALTTVKGQVKGDDESAMTYGSGGVERRYSERLAQNILVGADIIPGLAERTVVETSRISKANPALGEKIKSVDGTALIKFLLKDLLRPQAMVPNSVVIERRYIEPPPKPPASDSGKGVDTEGGAYEEKGAHGTHDSAPSGRAALVDRGLAELNELAEAWRRRGNVGNPPHYLDWVVNIRSVVDAPEHLGIEQLRAQVDGWLHDLRGRWV